MARIHVSVLSIVHVPIKQEIFHAGGLGIRVCFQVQVLKEDCMPLHKTQPHDICLL